MSTQHEAKDLSVKRRFVSGRRVWKEDAVTGVGYDIREQACQRLGDDFRAELDAVTTSGDIRRLALRHEGVLTKAESKEFVHYADYIGILFGFQNEPPITSI